MSDTVIRVENVSKLYRLGEVGTGSLAHDVNRWWHKVRGKENPYLKIGEVNDRTKPAKQATAYGTTNHTNKHEKLTTEDTESTEGAGGARLAGQAGAAFSNPSTSELAQYSENTSLTRCAGDPAGARIAPEDRRSELGYGTRGGNQHADSAEFLEGQLASGLADGLRKTRFHSLRE